MSHVRERIHGLNLICNHLFSTFQSLFTRAPSMVNEILDDKDRNIQGNYFSRAENGDAVFYKVDGERFEGGSKTLKFSTNTRYKITLTSKPPTHFHQMHLAGCDLQLHTDVPNSGQYTTEWNTTGIDVCKKGARNNIGLTLQVLLTVLLKTFTPALLV
ncbi:unnamed protein product [Angiostrongylus costaricensis]|uniref:CB1 cannabinoid receptor-interacting protein 1 n=1 Tax=Angiostrongylus costaricensis TaxID=334426 RepID=A0A0R3PAS7_ANGCS|nr:unnamed protein product [Angiostrongylus costaricensis]